MIAAALLALAGALAWRSACPLAARSTLPELRGTWDVLMIGGLDRPRPDSSRAESVISPDLQGCVLRERVLARTGNHRYEAMVFWGVNGADSAVQRVFVHSQHGRFGVYQGRRAGSGLRLRQQDLSGQSDSILVENHVLVRDHDHFMITSRLSNDRGRTWIALSRREYRRTPA